MSTISGSMLRTALRIGAYAVAATVGFSSVASAAEWKFAIEEGMNDIQGVYATHFKDYVEEHSGGNVSVTIYPYGTLGEGADTTQLAQRGAVQLVNISPGLAGDLIPELQAFLIPYLLPEDPQALETFYRDSASLRNGMGGMYREQGLQLLDVYGEGEVVMTTKKPVRSPADLSDVKFRIMTSPLLISTYQEFGATPTPLPWGEVYSGLQLNMIDGQENPLSFVWSTKIYEVIDYIVFAGHNNFTTSVAANAEFFDGLSESDRALLRDAQAASFAHIMKYQKSLEEESLKQILDTRPSVQVIRLSDEERAPFRAAADAVRDEYVSLTGESGRKFLQSLIADAAAAAVN